MPGYFFDSSALGKRYHSEVGTAHVETSFQAPQPPRFISRLSVVELQSVFAGKVRTHAITEADLELLRARFLQDIARREFRIIRMTDVHYREAERLIPQHEVRRSLRTLDALQLSAALTLHRRVALDAFVCADQGLCRVAQEEGLHIINPEFAQQRSQRFSLSRVVGKIVEFYTLRQNRWRFNRIPCRIGKFSPVAWCRPRFPAGLSRSVEIFG